MKRRNFIGLSTVAMAGAMGAGNPVISLNFFGHNNPAADGGEEVNPDAKWLLDAKWGLFSHFLPRAPNMKNPANVTSKLWNNQVNSFNVTGLGDQLQSLDARYFFITLGKDFDYFCSPNSRYENLFGSSMGKLTERDLVADLAADLIPRGIRLCVYLPALGSKGSASEQQMYQQVIREWSERWGKSISAWWVDDSNLPEADMYKAYAKAFKAGNEDALIAFNAGPIVYTYNILKPPTDHEDYFAGYADWLLPVCQVRYFDKHEFWVGPDYYGDQLHFLTFLGSYWGTGDPRFPDDLVIGWTQHTNNYSGTITWDVPLDESGLIPARHLNQLSALRDNIGSRSFVHPS